MSKKIVVYLLAVDVFESALYLLAVDVCESVIYLLVVDIFGSVFHLLVVDVCESVVYLLVVDICESFVGFGERLMTNRESDWPYIRPILTLLSFIIVLVFRILIVSVGCGCR
jgi:hypothetical protein